MQLYAQHSLSDLSYSGYFPSFRVICTSQWAVMVLQLWRTQLEVIVASALSVVEFLFVFSTSSLIRSHHLRRIRCHVLLQDYLSLASYWCFTYTARRCIAASRLVAVLLHSKAVIRWRTFTINLAAYQLELATMLNFAYGVLQSYYLFIRYFVSLSRQKVHITCDLKQRLTEVSCALEQHAVDVAIYQCDPLADVHACPRWTLWI